VNALNYFKQTPLFKAVYNGDLKVCKILIENGADPMVLDVFGNSPLSIACENDRWDIFKLFIESDKADPSLIDDLYSNGETLLTMACTNKNLAIIKLLVDSGANLGVPNIYGNTPLKCSLEERDITTSKYLIDNGAQIRPDNND